MRALGDDTPAVEDEDAIAEPLAEGLRREGWDVDRVATGAGALERAGEADIVLLDVMMPGEIDGLQVLEAIKADPDTRDTLVAMITARGQVADHDDARARGADAYFIKPFSPLQVVTWVRSHLK